MKKEKQILDRFKCRWWDAKSCFMAEVITLDIKNDYAIVLYRYADEFTPDEEVCISDGILMQHTGLYDKDEKDIYEGDVLKVDEVGDCEGEFIYYQVHFVNGAFRYFNDPESEVLSSDINEGGNFYFNGTVIGNVYENPELQNDDNFCSN